VSTQSRFIIDVWVQGQLPFNKSVCYTEFHYWTKTHW
jgi:hypothetical protein